MRAILIHACALITGIVIIILVTISALCNHDARQLEFSLTFYHIQRPARGEGCATVDGATVDGATTQICRLFWLCWRWLQPWWCKCNHNCETITGSPGVELFFLKITISQECSGVCLKSRSEYSSVWSVQLRLSQACAFQWRIIPANRRRCSSATQSTLMDRHVPKCFWAGLRNKATSSRCAQLVGATSVIDSRHTRILKNIDLAKT